MFLGLIIEPKFTFFKMIVTGIFSDSTELRTSGFGAPKSSQSP